MNFTIYEIYATLLQALKTIYTGEMYLIIEKLIHDYDWDESDSVLALNVMSYELKGRYGRETNDQNAKLDEEFSLTFYPEDSLDALRVKFIEKIL